MQVDQSEYHADTASQRPRRLCNTPWTASRQRRRRRQGTRILKTLSIVKAWQVPINLFIYIYTTALPPVGNNNARLPTLQPTPFSVGSSEVLPKGESHRRRRWYSTFKTLLNKNGCFKSLNCRGHLLHQEVHAYNFFLQIGRRPVPR